MKLTRLYTGDDGKSHFEDVKVSQLASRLNRLIRTRELHLPSHASTVADSIYYLSGLNAVSY
jgi:hypothetical protein